MPIGGFSTSRPDLPRPVGAESIATLSLWRLDSTPIRTAQRVGRRIHVVGLCGATAEEVQALADRPVPTSATWQWPGTYAVLEELDHGLVLHTDPAAALPLYAVAWRGTWAWSTSARHLAALAGGRIDIKRLACAFLAPSVPALASGLTYFSGVEQLPPGSRIELPATGDRYTCSTTWCPSPLAGPPPHLRLRNALTAAVRLRADIDPALSSDLSGGLDSTTVAVLASRAVPGPVNAVTIHPRGVLDGADLRYARLTATASHGRLRHHLLPLGDEHRPYTGLTDVPVSNEPAPSTLTHTRLLAQFRWIRRELGTRTHLTGDGGDSVLFQPPAHLADLLHHRRHIRAAREAFGWARLRHTAVVPLLRSAAVMTTTTREHALTGLVTELISGLMQDREDVGWFFTLPVPTWANPSAVRLLTEAAEGYAAAPDPLPGIDASVRILVDEIREVARTAVADAELADTCGIELHNPFLDASVVDAVLRAPLDRRPPLYAYKPVLTRAFADVLPAELAARTTKGAFEADHYGGLRAALPELLETGGLNLAALGLIDAKRFRDRIRQAAAGVPMPLAHIEHLGRRCLVAHPRSHSRACVGPPRPRDGGVMERSVDFGHVQVVIDYDTGGVRCLIPAEPAPSTAPKASWGSTEHRAGLTVPHSAWSPTAAAVLAGVLAVKAAGKKESAMRRLIDVLRTATSMTTCPTTPWQAERAVLAVRRTAWYSPTRTACLEESAAAVLLLALRRRSAVWCHGVAPDPVRLHAWVQTDDGALAAEPPSTLLYTPVLTIGNTHD